MREQWLIDMEREAAEHKAQVLAAAVGDHVTAPRGGMPCVLAMHIRENGLRLVTSDGGIVDQSWCEHADLGRNPESLGYFEFVSDVAHPLSGVHGWQHVLNDCRKVTQWG